MNERPRPLLLTGPARLAALGAFLLVSAGPLGAVEAFGAGDGEARFFEARVRPVLAARCFRCHSAEAGKARGGLRLDAREALLRGGDSGPAIVPGNPAASPLVTAISYKDPDREMPPDERLPDEEIAVLIRWVAAGAPWPAAAPAARPERAIADADRAWWAFQPIRPPAPPSASHRGFSRNPIDRFVSRALAGRGLSPAPAADRRTLIRRLTFDLHGLPPTPEEVDAFARDRAPDAYERLVDRLMASPRYGERLARFWLDLVRYAESDGFRQDAYRPQTWPYRDWVVRSFNEDKPFDRFVLEQLAGDEIAPEDPGVFVATGFLRLGPYEFNQRDVARQWSDILNEVTDLTGDVFLGLGMACARCHDHKFDPLLRRDYYRLQAFLAPILWRDDRSLATPEEAAEDRRALAAWESRTAALRAEIAAIERPYLDRGERGALEMFLPELRALVLKPVAERAPLEHQIAELAARQIAYARTTIDDKIKGAERERWSALRKRLEETTRPPRPPLPALVVSDVGPVAPPTVIPGDPPERTIEAGFPSVLDPRPAAIPGPGEGRASTGRRTALARWIGSPDNPLTARVIANRFWQLRFGRGLVGTASDFGRLGERPSHPELLDWLAAELLTGGWRLKALDRLIVTSATYRQASRNPRAAAARLVDPDGRLLWRARPRRLEAEQVRDAILQTSGELDLAMGGPSVEPSEPRRSLYTRVLRNNPDPLLAAFDAADGNGSVSLRNVTTTATQSLLLMNAAWPLARAERFAARVQALAGLDRRAAVEQAFRLAYGRLPGAQERALALAFLGSGPRTRARADVAADGTSLAASSQIEVMPHRGGRAARMRPGRTEDWLRVPAGAAPAGDGFALEAVVLLDSADERRRVIVSGARPSWVFAVERGRLLLEIDGKAIASDLRFDPHRPQLVAVSVTEDAVTFLCQDLSDPDAPLRAASVRRRGAVPSPAGALTIGGRDGAAAGGWDGLVDEVRVGAALDRERLLVREDAASPSGVAGHWRFEPTPGFLEDSGPGRRTLARPSSPTGAATGAHPKLVDLCHVLITSNELLYVR